MKYSARPTTYVLGAQQSQPCCAKPNGRRRRRRRRPFKKLFPHLLEKPLIPLSLPPRPWQEEAEKGREEDLTPPLASSLG